MDYCSYFIDNKALFGSYPNSESFNILKENGVRYFVDLTTSYEKNKLFNYSTNEDINYLNYEIKDRYIPTDIYSFTKFIYNVNMTINILKGNDKIYIHCKGGHGRAGLLVSCILSYRFKYTGERSLELTNSFHNNRKVMNDKWRKIGSPQTEYQKNFVIRLFKPIYLNNIHIKNTYYPLNNKSNFSININNMYARNACIYFYSIIDKTQYKNLMNTKNMHELNKVLLNINDNSSIDKIELYTKILTHKFNKHKDIKLLLTKTLIRPIIYMEGNINIGEIWEKIRNTLVLKN